ncbi:MULTISPECIES: DNA repair protein [Gordonibacter]|uniref:DNA repair protein n=1 Tax=Gordonibacter faecis TaxID=3047475 RepID=A0ABT7DMS2_9ACTN|nr:MULTISPECIES: DNA repair protein [unclassified Gordonibacter]MDJ1650813.1 DNA repair protein [Gordonibacter sp. KGMB12511]HIW77157.1 DNA repair protein [Candidatus Gordonibacter avicola]
MRTNVQLISWRREGIVADERTYLCIDLKSFYASVECADRGLDPFTTNLVVADPDRTEKTICLAVSPALKALGLPGRCRVFEIPPGIDYIKARPRMQRYMDVSADIYSIYLRYVSPEDIHPYSIDECFIDATPYLALYHVDARAFAQMLMDAVLAETGVCATAGIGSNLFLAKVALDITAKHADDHIGVLDRATFEQTIQTHRPITDIWNIGPGIAKRLAKHGVHDLRGVCELDESTLYCEFGVNAEYLIDHAHGVEPCTIADIRAYEPGAHSLMNGQVLPCDYTFDEARDVVKEMVDQLVLDLVDKHLVASSLSLYVGYAKGEGDRAREAAEGWFDGGHGRRPVSGRRGFPHTGGTRRQSDRTNSLAKLLPRFLDLYDETTRRDVAVRRIHVGFGDVVPEELATFDLFTDVATEAEERKLQEAVLAVKGKFGKNALLRGTSLKEKATARERNQQIGGHHA